MDKERATSKQCAARSEAIRKQNAATFKQRDAANRAWMGNMAATFNARRNASLAIHAGFENTLGSY